KIIDRLVNGEGLEHALFGRKRFAGRLVSSICRQPDPMTDGELIVVEGDKIHRPLTSAVVAVLLVVANAHHNTKKASAPALLAAQRTESGIGLEVVELRDAILDVVGR